MADYWLISWLLRAVGYGFLALSALGIGLALWLPKRWWGKLAALLVVGWLISIPVRQANQEAAQRQVAADAYKQRYATAKAMFDERCKTAGVKIHRTVENVDGFLLMKVRSEKINFSDQYAMDDPYGLDLGGDGYIRQMLTGKLADGVIPDTTSRQDAPYRFVVAKDPQDGRYYRYELGADPPHRAAIPMVRTPVQERQLPRYGVTFDDISTKEERDYWIAGSSLKVIDLKTQEVLAERVGYMFDAGQGNKSGERSPWLFAVYNACPGFPKLNGDRPQQLGQTRYFIEKVLQSKRLTQGEKK